MLAAATTTDDFLLALAQGTTALLAVATGVVTFLVGRAVARKRAGDTVFEMHLAGIVIAGLYVVACDVLSWWAWCQIAARPKDFLFGWPVGVWLSILFLPPAIFSGGCGVLYGAQLVARVRRDIKGRWRA